jgi:hypothetical protein
MSVLGLLADKDMAVNLLHVVRVDHKPCRVRLS